MRSLLALVVLSSTAFAQHDYKSTRALLRDGKWAEAIALANELAAKDPKDSEWIVQRSLAEAASGDVDAALTSFKKAISMGVAEERFVGEARNVLAPVMKNEALAKWVADNDLAFLHGPMLGDLKPTSVRVWVRTTKPGPVAVVVTPAKGDADFEVFTGRTTEDGDLATTIQVDGLKPGTEYRYEVEFDDDGTGITSAPRTFRTLSNEPQKVSIAFGGGAGYVPENERMWSTIGKFDPTALVLLGDNVYVDMPEHPAMQRFCYYRRHSVPEWRTLVGARPVYTIWDDHDFGTNDCWGGPKVDDPKWKPDVWSIYKQNWVNPGYGGGEERPGCWYDFRLGDVHFVMLDGRYYRERPRNENASMLGPEQLAWAKKTLAASEATFKVIASPVPWEFATKGDSRDTWNGFKAERNDLFDFLADEEIDGVILLSADRHRSDAWKITREKGYPLYEFESSRLTNRHVHGTMKQAIFSYNAKQSFGLVEFDPTAADPTVTYKVVNIDGEVMHELTVKRSELKSPK